MGICIDRFVLLKIKNRSVFSGISNSLEDFVYNITSSNSGDIEELSGNLRLTKNTYLSFSERLRFVIKSKNKLFFKETADEFPEIYDAFLVGDIYVIIDSWLADINYNFKNQNNMPNYSANYIIWIGTLLDKSQVENLIMNIQAINLGMIDDIIILESILKSPDGDHVKEYFETVEYCLKNVH